MPDDRFGDLGPRERPPAKGTRAGEKLADLDRTEPEKRRPSYEPGRSYMWVVGVAGVIVIVIVAINSLQHPGRGSRGPEVGKAIPRFAAPNATDPRAPDGDANIKQSKSDDGTGNKTPACDVHVPGSLRSCDFTSKPLVLTFIVPGAKDCEAFMDRIQRVKASYPDVNFVGVVSGVGTGRVKDLVKEHHWNLPVAVDHNLAVFTTYRVAVCATAVFARRGGIVAKSKVEAQSWSDARLRAEIEAIRR